MGIFTVVRAVCNTGMTLSCDLFSPSAAFSVSLEKTRFILT